MTQAKAELQESERVDVLSTYGIGNSFSDAALDRITQLTAKILGAPMAMVSLVEDARQLFASRVGTDLCETDRSSSFCAHALGTRSILQVPDARLDPRFAKNPLVTGPPYVRSYVGCPLVAPSGHILGALCVMGTEPRSLISPEERSNLQDLAALVMDRLELRRLDLAWQTGIVRFERLANVSPEAIVCVNENALITFWNPAAERLFGFMRADVINVSVATLAPEHGVSKLFELASSESAQAVGRTTEMDIVSASGVRVPVEVATSVWREGTQANFFMVLRDITERRRNEEQSYRLVHIDALTNLPNRKLFRDRTEACLATGESSGVFVIDLDGFKDVNDRFGHLAGDALLAATAQRLRQALPPSATAARMGGDEFAVVLPGVEQAGALGLIADQLIASLSQPLMIDGESVVKGASVGIARFPEDASTVRELFANADLALYDAKAHGKNCRRFFSAGLRDVANAKQAYLNEFARALENHEWVVFYEPFVRLADRAFVGSEAQLRWQHPQHGLLDQAAFASALRASPLAPRVGQWMLETACRQLAVWRAARPQFRMCVPILDAQFRAGDLGDRVRECLLREGLQGSPLEVEVTEATLLRSDVETLATFADLREQGVSVSLANYGTGKASLDLLKRAPITRLKIDPVFVRRMFDSTADAAIIRVILYLGKSLNLAVTAKGVVSETQFRQLLRKGCEEAQGTWFGEPTLADCSDK